MWFWYSTQARLEAAERERDARNDRLAGLLRRARDGRVAQVEPLAPRLHFTLRLRQALHHT